MNPRGQERGAIILAGGLSSRFGSNKALQTLGGKPLICHMIERVSSVADEVVVVLGRGESGTKYDAALPPHVRVVNDDREGKNPIVGMVAGLGAIESAYAVILACDAPFVSSEVIELLFQRALKADAAIPRWNLQRIEPLQAVYCRVSTLRAALETVIPPDLSIEDMIAKLERVVYVSVEDEIAAIDRDLITFFNINTREDLATAESMIAGQTNFESIGSSTRS
jgi:molybdopterin-guanine dinucleotide biosynthesis protein A